MEDAGWVSSLWDREQTQGPPRRVYALTEEGYQALYAWKTHLEQTREIIAHLLQTMNESDGTNTKGV
jgi:DNA-binding PadR family transcriptional regulator